MTAFDSHDFIQAYNQNSIHQDILSKLERKALAEGVPLPLFKAMHFAVRSEWDMHSHGLRLIIEWRDFDSDHKRAISDLMRPPVLNRHGGLRETVDKLMDNISIRGEMFFLRLIKKFPRHLKSVTCDGSGGAVVTFKNGHNLETPETELESPDFLARCSMIYDL